MLAAPTTEDTSAAALLDRAVAFRDQAAEAERQKLIAVAAWADAHTTGALMPDLCGPLGIVDEDKFTAASDAWVARYGMPGADAFLDLAGPGAPEVSHFAVIELAAALGLSTDSGRLLVGDVIEAKHRLPKIWQRLLDGQVEGWRVRRTARQTRTLSPDAAAFLDTHLAHVVHAAGPATVDRLILEAAARFDPEETEGVETETRSGLYVDLDLRTLPSSLGKASTVHLDACLDRADAEELDAALSALAAQQAANGSTEDLPVRRARAFGHLARGHWTLDLTPTDTDTTPAIPAAEPKTAADPAAQHHATDPMVETTEAGAADPVVEVRAQRATRPHQPTDTRPTSTRGRQVVLHVHLTRAALHGTPEVDPVTGQLGLHLARVENHRQTVTADTVREWCTVPGTKITVKPVIDLAETVSVEAYEIPDRIAARVRLQRPTCAFPHCTRPARAAEGNLDLDHTTEWRPPDKDRPPGHTAGTTSTDNLAPLCRTHHRTKTHPSPHPGPGGDRWHYRRLSSGTWHWTSPHGRHYLVHPDGTSTL